jgi:glycine cleavage system H lipoate-binding protein
LKSFFFFKSHVLKSQTQTDHMFDVMQVNASPYEKGWIIKVEVSDSGELKKLMDADQYSKFCEEEDAKH